MFFTKWCSFNTFESNEIERQYTVWVTLRCSSGLSVIFLWQGFEFLVDILFYFEGFIPVGFFLLCTSSVLSSLLWCPDWCHLCLLCVSSLCARQFVAFLAFVRAFSPRGWLTNLWSENQESVKMVKVRPSLMMIRQAAAAPPSRAAGSHGGIRLMSTPTGKNISWRLWLKLVVMMIIALFWWSFHPAAFSMAPVCRQRGLCWGCTTFETAL